MRFAITGGRSFYDGDAVYWALMRGDPPAANLVHSTVDTMVNGCCPTGADDLAKQIWEGWGGKLESYPAKWRQHGVYNPAAGFIRNQEMVDSGIGLLIAFPGGYGTAHMIKAAEKAGVRVERFPR